MIMQLVESGELSLDDTIDAWVTVRAPTRSRSGCCSATRAAWASAAQACPRRARDVVTPEELLARAVAAGPVGERAAPMRLHEHELPRARARPRAGDRASWTDNLAPASPRRSGSSGLVATLEPPRRASPRMGERRGEWVNALDVLDPSIGWGYGGMTSTNREMMIFAQAFFGSSSSRASPRSRR